MALLEVTQNNSIAQHALDAHLRAGRSRSFFNFFFDSWPPHKDSARGMPDRFGCLTATERERGAGEFNACRSLASLLPSLRLHFPRERSDRLPISKWHCILYGDGDPTAAQRSSVRRRTARVAYMAKCLRGRKEGRAAMRKRASPSPSRSSSLHDVMRFRDKGRCGRNCRCRGRRNIHVPCVCGPRCQQPISIF